MADSAAAYFHHSSDGAGPYVIKVRGRVERHWEPELQMQLSYAQTEAGVVSVLTGQLPDQAALLGALSRLAMWGYQIILVQYQLPPFQEVLAS
jgi:hypothetical protein